MQGQSFKQGVNALECFFVVQGDT